MRLLLIVFSLFMITPSAMANDIISIQSPYSFATPSTAKNGAAFMIIENKGDSDDRLMAATSNVAEIVEVHENYIDKSDRMKMRALKDGIEIKAGETTTLKPAGYHIMFTRLHNPLKEGQDIPLTLRFEKAGDIELTVPVIKLGQSPNMKHDH